MEIIKDNNEMVDSVISFVKEEKNKHFNPEDITEEDLNNLPTKLVQADESSLCKSFNNDIMEDNSEVLLALSDKCDDFNLTDEESSILASVLLRYKSGEKFSYYDAMPDSIKKIINTIISEEKISDNLRSTITMSNNIAEMFLKSLLSDESLDNSIDEFDRSIKDALNIPSMNAMYLDAFKDSMINKLNEIADKVKEEDEAKAESLLKIKNAYIDSTTFDKVRKAYKENSKLRKAVRRRWKDASKVCGEYDLRIKYSEFKTSNTEPVIDVLNKVLVGSKEFTVYDLEDTEKNYNITVDIEVTIEDVKKLVVLLCESCVNMDPHDIVQATYMYYLIKNIVMIDTNTTTITPFVAELINNIIDLIKLIRETEVEFNEHRNVSKSSRRKKS